jgi:23S rRNA maturation-related 3'-5' exoribonuclease YhaM
MMTNPYYVKKVSELKTKSDDLYWILDLISTDRVPVKGIVWKPFSVVDESEGAIFENNAYVFDASETMYKGEKQLNIQWAERADIDVSVFMRVPLNDPDELLSQLKTFLTDNIKTPAYRAIMKGFLLFDDEFFSKLKRLPRTTNYDFSYPGGLLQSIMYTTELALQTSLVLGLPEESKELIVCSVLFADLGKISELTFDFTKTDVGNLLGHQYLSCQLLEQIDRETDFAFQTDILKVKHCILTHHIDDIGNWSVVKVKLREANLVNSILQLVFKNEEWELRKK